MTRSPEFSPAWASPPGETIRVLASKKCLPYHRLAEAVGISQEELALLFNGDLPITTNRAKGLATVLDASERFWLSREKQYRHDLQALKEDARRWLSSLPFTDMVRFGWVHTAASHSSKLQSALKFFNVADVDEWRDSWMTERAGLTAYRTSPVFNAQSASVAAWLRQGELVAEELKTMPWSRSDFKHLLPTLKPLTRVDDPAEFLPQLQQRCAACGVAVVVVRAPKGCPASGATRVKNGQAILQLSVRYLRDDSFWFTFFHEAGHLLLHEGRLFLEGSDQSELNAHHESEANNFAEKFLIPESHQASFLNLPHDLKSIMRFARNLSISPGLVVGQLQHHGLVRQDKLNYLKKRYSWPD